MRDTVCGTVENVTAAKIVRDVSRKLEAGQLASDIKAHINHLRRQSMRNAYLAVRIIEGKDGIRTRLKSDD